VPGARIDVGSGEVSPILRGSFSITLGLRTVHSRSPSLVQTGIILGSIEEGFEVGGHLTSVGCDVTGRGFVVPLVGVDEDLLGFHPSACSFTFLSPWCSAVIKYRALVGLVFGVVDASMVTCHQFIQHQRVVDCSDGDPQTPSDLDVPGPGVRPGEQVTGYFC
jgi:hypothetical protein